MTNNCSKMYDPWSIELYIEYPKQFDLSKAELLIKNIEKYLSKQKDCYFQPTFKQVNIHRTIMEGVLITPGSIQTINKEVPERIVSDINNTFTTCSVLINNCTFIKRDDDFHYAIVENFLESVSGR